MSPLVFAVAVLAMSPVVVVALALVRMALLKSRRVERPSPLDPRQPDQRAIKRLARAIQYRTISHEDKTRFDDGEFLRFRDFLQRSYPRVHSTLAMEVVGDYSLLYTWTGARADLNPIMQIAHLDVTPAEPEENWTHPPFAGTIADGYIWGRGAMDMKLGVLGLLEAVELLLESGFQPQRTVYLAFGHDEELGGYEGAARIAQVLRSRGVELEYLLDEGLFITNGLVPGVSAPVAIVAVAEKGYLSVELTAQSEGGHSSAPPPQTCVGILSAAIRRIESNPFPASLKGPVWQLFEYAGPEMSFVNRLVFANRWLFGWLIKRRLASSPPTNALIRTTGAATFFEGGVKENVLPTSARAIVNFRIRPGDDTGSVLDHVRRVVSDPRVAVRPITETASEPSAVSDVDATSFHTLAGTVRQVFPGVVVAPSLLVGRTDSLHYAGLAKNIYRFLPQRLGKDDTGRIHGVDERISVENYSEVIRFYTELIRNSTQ